MITQIGEKLENILKGLSDEEKDDLYRRLWAKYVREDIHTQLKDMDIELTDEQIENVVDRFVWDGQYDCNLSYWDNLKNLIEKVSII